MLDYVSAHLHVQFPHISEKGLDALVVLGFVKQHKLHIYDTMIKGPSTMQL